MDAYSEIMEYFDTIPVENLDNEWLTLIQECRIGLAREKVQITVFGEFNAGKSTLINAILGNDVLPTGILPTTFYNTRINYGQIPHATAILKNNETQTISMDVVSELRRFTNESTLDKNIASIELEYPSPLLVKGVTLVDTGGFNDTIDQSAKTLEELSRTDLAIFVLSSLSLKQTEREHIDIIQKAINGNIIFIYNPSYLLHSGQELEEHVTWLKEQLAQTGNDIVGIPAPFWIVSAKHSMSPNAKLHTEHYSTLTDVIANLSQLVEKCTNLLFERARFKVVATQLTSVIRQIYELAERKIADVELMHDTSEIASLYQAQIACETADFVFDWFEETNDDAYTFLPPDNRRSLHRSTERLVDSVFYQIRKFEQATGLTIDYPEFKIGSLYQTRNEWELQEKWKLKAEKFIHKANKLVKESWKKYEPIIIFKAEIINLHNEIAGLTSFLKWGTEILSKIMESITAFDEDFELVTISENPSLYQRYKTLLLLPIDALGLEKKAINKINPQREDVVEIKTINQLLFTMINEEKYANYFVPMNLRRRGAGEKTLFQLTLALKKVTSKYISKNDLKTIDTEEARYLLSLPSR